MKRLFAVILCLVLAYAPFAYADEYHDLKYYQDLLANNGSNNISSSFDRYYEGTGVIAFYVDTPGPLKIERVYFIRANDESDASPNAYFSYSPFSPVYYTIAYYWPEEIQNGIAYDDTYQIAETGDSIYFNGRFNAYYSATGLLYFYANKLTVLEKGEQAQ